MKSWSAFLFFIFFFALLWAHCKSQLWTQPAEPLQLYHSFGTRKGHKPHKLCGGNWVVSIKESKNIIIVVPDYQWLDMLSLSQSKSERLKYKPQCLISYCRRCKRGEKKAVWWRGAKKSETYYLCHEMLWKSLKLSSRCPGNVANIHSACLLKKSTHSPL